MHIQVRAINSAQISSGNKRVKENDMNEKLTQLKSWYYRRLPKYLRLALHMLYIYIYMEVAVHCTELSERQ